MSLTPEQNAKIKEYLQTMGRGDEQDAFLSLTLSEWDVEKAVQSDRRMSNEQQLEPYFDVCLFRFSNLHSWYKFGTSPTLVTLVPVLGHEQECYTDQSPPCVPEDGVSWHFMLEHRGADYKFPESPEAEALERFLKEQRILVPEGRSIYFNGSWKSNLFYRLPPKPWTGEQVVNLQRSALNDHLAFAKQFVHFQTFYQQCLEAKRRIISFLNTQDLQAVLPRFRLMFMNKSFH